MVKTTSLSTLMLLAALTIMLGGCAARGPFARVTPESLVLSRGPASSFLSLAELSGTLYAVYADRATTTLDLVEIPGGPHLPATAPAPEVIDKVDVVPPLSPAFGDHVLSVAGGTEADPVRGPGDRREERPEACHASPGTAAVGAGDPRTGGRSPGARARR